jgi:hypothetical protein
MTNRRPAVRLIEAAAFMAMMYLVVQLAVAWGIEEKSWWQRSWEFVVGGGIGLALGAVFFFVFGAIGWVCGALYGAVGLIGLMACGALGGLGLGVLANIIRNPSRYNFNWLIIYVTLLVGGLISKGISALIGRKVEQLALAATTNGRGGSDSQAGPLVHDAARDGETHGKQS